MGVKILLLRNVFHEIDIKAYEFINHTKRITELGNFNPLYYVIFLTRSFLFRLFYTVHLVLSLKFRCISNATHYVWLYEGIFGYLCICFTNVSVKLLSEVTFIHTVLMISTHNYYLD